MKEVSKEEVIDNLKGDYTQEEIDVIFAYHTDHKIFEDDNGVYRWEKIIDWEKDENMDPNSVVMKYARGKMTQEEYMAYNRSIGYSLYGYWEIFYFNSRFDEQKYRIEMAEKRNEKIDEIFR